MMIRHDMTRTINLTLITDDDTEERFIIDDDHGGVDIRSVNDAKVEADRSAVVDLAIPHCQACHDGRDIREILDLTQDEADILTRWRTRKQDGIDSKLLGEILDKVVRSLSRTIQCDSRHERIVLKVEPAL